MACDFHACVYELRRVHTNEFGLHRHDTTDVPPLQPEDGHEAVVEYALWLPELLDADAEYHVAEGNQPGSAKQRYVKLLLALFKHFMPMCGVSASEILRDATAALEAPLRQAVKDALTEVNANKALVKQVIDTCMALRRRAPYSPPHTLLVQHGSGVSLRDATRVMLHAADTRSACARSCTATHVCTMHVRAHTQAGRQLKWTKHAKEALANGLLQGGDQPFVSQFVFAHNTEHGALIEIRVTGRSSDYHGASACTHGHTCWVSRCGRGRLSTAARPQAGLHHHTTKHAVRGCRVGGAGSVAMTLATHIKFYGEGRPPVDNPLTMYVLSPDGSGTWTGARKTTG